MLDIDSGEQMNALYKMYRIKGGKKEEKFHTTDIKRAIKFHKWYISRYKEGLYMEIVPEKSVYNWKEKKISKSY